MHLQAGFPLTRRAAHVPGTSTLGPGPEPEKNVCCRKTHSYSAGTPPLLVHEPVCKHTVHVLATALPLGIRGDPRSICKTVGPELRASLCLCEMGCTPDSAVTRAQLQPGAASDLVFFVVVFGSADVNAELSREAE